MQSLLEKGKDMKKVLFINTLIISVLLISLSVVSGQTSAAKYVDMTSAAEQSVHAVVHIKTTFKYRTSVWEDFFGGSFWEDFFGNNALGTREYEAMGAGYGVIISPDGYIITNNHVVEDAENITVTLNDKREFTASIAGTDPETDLALIKIDCQNLPILQFGNSDDLKIGEWVLAVGNPFNLTSTVTAGIVSAKARNLDILGKNSSIESFIQTDAAVNQGNSGGALVNVKGELVGINSAIASGNGYYTGYSFAIPSNIARKVVGDLKNYGKVQRATLGVNVIEIDYEKSRELGLDKVEGLLVAKVEADGAADQAGIAVDDVILAIDEREINSVSELREVITQHSPKENVTITILRNGTVKKVNVTLK